MKTTRTLRLLSLLGFLLLFAPFYDACEGEFFLKKIPEKESSFQNFSKKAYDVIVDEEAFTAIEIAETTVNGSFKEMTEEMKRVLKEKDWKNFSVFVSVIFDVVVLISLLIAILSFTKRIIILNKLALINLILTIITFLYIILLESSFNHFRQIKWGYYTFIITSVLIFIASKNLLIQKSVQK